MLSEGGPLGLADDPRCALGRLGVAFRLEAPISDGASDIITEAIVANVMWRGVVAGCCLYLAAIDIFRRWGRQRSRRQKRAKPKPLYALLRCQDS